MEQGLGRRWPARRPRRTDHALILCLSLYGALQLWLASKQQRQVVTSTPSLTFLKPFLKKLNSSLTPSHRRRVSRLAIPEMPCGSQWSESRPFFANAPRRAANNPLVWTVSGGKEYMAYLKIILEQWQSIDLKEVLLVALDEETANYVCRIGYQSVLWDAPLTSYSKVADSKFEVAAVLAEVGLPAFFMEVDVFCKQNPIPLFVDEGIVVTSHGFADFVPNIGQFYVEPKQEIADYFRSVRAVLLYSQKHKQYSVMPSGKGTIREFFDQYQFYRCLPPTNPRDLHYNTSHGMYLLDQPDNNLLAICRNVSHAAPFPWRTVSNVYISAHSPPTIYDSTICVHPLSDAPFSSFRLKLATAQFLGYDPLPIHASQKFLKTISGDLNFNECWVFPFVGDAAFPNDKSTHFKFKLILSHLILLARSSGRTLVLPRYFRDQNDFAVPVLSLVDIRSIEQWVPVKLLPLSSDELQNFPTVVLGMEKEHQSMVKQLSEAGNKTVVALSRMCDVFPSAETPQVVAIVESLSCCCEDSRIKFVKSIGSWSRICDVPGWKDNFKRALAQAKSQSVVVPPLLHTKTQE